MSYVTINWNNEDHVFKLDEDGAPTKMVDYLDKDEKKEYQDWLKAGNKPEPHIILEHK
jgi:hypothetical protein